MTGRLFKIIPVSLSDTMQKMVGLRNIAIHDYQAINIDIVISVVTKHLDDFSDFSKTLLEEALI